MPKPNPRMILIPTLLVALGLTSYYVESGRRRQRSALSGFFESQPTGAASRILGRVGKLLVREGDRVTAGEPLVELETDSISQDTASRDALAEQARQNYIELKAGARAEDIAKQAAAVNEAEANLSKLRNGPLPEEIAQANARLRRAESILEKALAGSRPEEIEQSRAAERNAAARLAQAERGLTKQERDEARSRLDNAIAQEDLARREVDRYTQLFNQDAVSKQQVDLKQTDLRAATARRREMEEAWRLADTGTPKEELDQAREGYRQAKAALDLVLAGSRKEDIRAAEADVSEAKQALKQLQRGYRSEDIRAAVARLNAARIGLTELQTGNRKEQIAQAAAAASAAERTAKSAHTTLAENTVRSPIDGVVERIPVTVGDLVNPGVTLIRISNPSDLWLRIYVPEGDLQHVKVGSTASVKIDGVDTLLSAVVEAVATEGEFTPANLQTPDERGKQVFSVRLRLTQPDGRVKTGIAATVKQIGDWTP